MPSIRIETIEALAYRITFDDRSCTKSNDDYIRFYKDDSRKTVWGLNKYHGGNDDTPKLFPGVGDVEALIINSPSFEFSFTSSPQLNLSKGNNLWYETINLS